MLLAPSLAPSRSPMFYHCWPSFRSTSGLGSHINRAMPLCTTFRAPIRRTRELMPIFCAWHNRGTRKSGMVASEAADYFTKLQIYILHVISEPLGHSNSPQGLESPRLRRMVRWVELCAT